MQGLESAFVACPYCGERVELLIDCSQDDLQHYVEDCSVCCRPIVVDVRLSPGAGPRVRVRSEDE